MKLFSLWKVYVDHLSGFFLCISQLCTNEWSLWDTLVALILREEPVLYSNVRLFHMFYRQQNYLAASSVRI